MLHRYKPITQVSSFPVYLIHSLSLEMKYTDGRTQASLHAFASHTCEQNSDVTLFAFFIRCAQNESTRGFPYPMSVNELQLEIYWVDFYTFSINIVAFRPVAM
jgi:hypothetical protein